MGLLYFSVMKIKELTLFTAHPEQQRHFYAEVLGLDLVCDEKDRVSFRAGNSLLHFSRDKTTNPVHFAFIIPGDSYEQANTWLKQRVTLLPFEGREIIDFPNWNAKAQYFYDSDRNIVEFIARRDVESPWEAPFGVEAIKQIGEVGLPAKDLEALYEALNRLKPLPKYSGDFQRFGSAGDPEGLFILANPQEKDWFPTGDKIVPAHLCVRGDYNFEYQNGIIKEINTPL